ncbi:type II secretion system F family protein [Falsiroseomonas sp.]|uniref:type II secretion system F family protein n=1 Tax=Falsiroseomonas sp. TaxID=2870721 RepID=UPI00356A6332
MERLLSPAALALAASAFALTSALVVVLRGLQRERALARLDALTRRRAVREEVEADEALVSGELRAAGRVVRSHALLSEADARDLVRIASAAGVSPGRARLAFTLTKLLLTLVLPPATYFGMLAFKPGMALPATGLALVVGLLAPNWVLGALRRKFLLRTQRGLAEALDLMVVCSEAGLGLESAVERVAREMARSNRVVALEFSTLAHEMRMLPDRQQALTRLSERSASDDMRRLTATLSQTMRYGTPLAEAMRVLASDLRRSRMQRLEERAAKLPAMLVLPLILFIMPCLFVVLVGPAVVVLSHGIGAAR